MLQQYQLSSHRSQTKDFGIKSFKSSPLSSQNLFVLLSSDQTNNYIISIAILENHTFDDLLMFVQFYLWSDSIPYTVVDSIWLDAFETQLSCEWWKIQFFIWRHEPSLHRTRATWMMMIFSLKSWRSSLFASAEKNRRHSIGNSYCSSSFYGCHIFFVGPNLWSFFPFFSWTYPKNEGS